jgi:hypothetical protein
LLVSLWRRLPAAYLFIAFHEHPSPVNGILGTCTDAMLLASTLIWTFEDGNAIHHFKTSGPASRYAQSATRTLFFDHDRNPLVVHFAFPISSDRIKCN